MYLIPLAIISWQTLVVADKIRRLADIFRGTVDRLAYTRPVAILVLVVVVQMAVVHLICPQAIIFPIIQTVYCFILIEDLFRFLQRVDIAS
jgi:hypothetical protein